MFMSCVHVHVSSSNHLMCIAGLERLYNLKCCSRNRWSLIPRGRYHNGELFVSARLDFQGFIFNHVDPPV